MGNVRKVLRRDILRLLKVPVSWVIIIALMILPSFYAWVNILGFWNPYGNTANVRVSVANTDQGVEDGPMGAMNLGGQIEDQLHDNHDIGWTFTTETQAMEDVRSGASYAAIIIPKSFSADLGAMLDGSGIQPTLHYYVNEKISPIAPKVTDTAASTVDREVNSTFVSTVSEVVSETLNQVNANIETTASKEQQQALDAIGRATDDLDDVISLLNGLADDLGNVPTTTQQARQTLQNTRQLGKDAANGLTDISGIINSSQTGLNTFITNTSSSLDTGSSLASQSIMQATSGIGIASSAIITANGHVSGALANLQGINNTTGGILEQLNDLVVQYPDLADSIGANISDMQNANAAIGGVIDDLTQLNSGFAQTAEDTGALAEGINTAAQQSLASIDAARHSISEQTLPKFNTAMNGLASSTGTMSGIITSQGTLVDQANIVLDQLDSTAQTAKTALSDTAASLSDTRDHLNTIATDLNALSTSSQLSTLLGGDGTLDVDRIADFMLSPTVIDTKTMYPVNSYGSGMAPLFTNLSLWVGAFMLVVLLKLETDDEGIDGLTVTQGYLGRWALLTIIAVAQGAVAVIGDLIIGVQTVNAAMFILTGILTSLAYLSIAYALSTTFLHIGKALCLVLIMVQIPGATGMYPIEMMPAFFRDMSPFFPFTYGINAMRETIAGFYGNTWLHDMAYLLGFTSLAFALGLLIRPLMTNVNRLFAREIEQGDLLAGEPSRLPAREYSISQALQALADRDEYRSLIEERTAGFTRLYPKLRRGALIAGLLVPAIMAIAFSLTNSEKVFVLGAWTIWALLIIAFLMTIEVIRDRINRQMRLGNLDEETVRAFLALSEVDKLRAKVAKHRRGNGRHGKHDDSSKSGDAITQDLSDIVAAATANDTGTANRTANNRTINNHTANNHTAHSERNAA